MICPLLCLLFATLLPQTEREWREKLGEERYRIMRQKGTERAFTGEHLSLKQGGLYCCAACEAPLFDADEQYDLGNGWPSFKRPLTSQAVYYERDEVPFVERYEVLCRGCGSHLGHLFRDGPPPTHFRYSINSIALTFNERK